MACSKSLTWAIKCLILFIAVGILIPGAISCRKEVSFGPPPNPCNGCDTMNTDSILPMDPPPLLVGQGRVLLDGKPWHSEFHTTDLDEAANTFTIYAMDQYGFFLRSFIQIIDIPLEEGEYELEEWNAPLSVGVFPPDFLFTWFDDTPRATFVVDTSGIESYVRITEYNSFKRTVKGEFQAGLYNVFGAASVGLPYKVEFTKGEFFLKL